MRILLLIMSILWVALGAAIVLYTSPVRAFLGEFILGMNLRLMALGPLFAGLLLLLGAFLVPEVFWVVLVLALLALAKGVYLAFGPLVQIRSVLEWWFDRAGETAVRAWGLIAFTLGVMLCSWLL
jgi:hypothetical protein